MKKPTFLRTLRITRHRPDAARDVGDEIEFYLEMRTRELIAGGMEPEEAARAARAAFGDRGRIEAECRRISGTVARRRRLAEALGSFAGDVRNGLRQIARRPALSLTVVATWALCLGANAAIFSLVHGILLAPLPYPAPDELVTLVRGLPEAGAPRLDSSLGDYVELRDGVGGLRSVALYNRVSRGVGEPGRVDNVFSMDVTTSFFDVVGVRPALGRGFVEADGEPGAPRRVVIAHELWRERLSGEPDPVGRELVIDREPYTVIGVMPEGFLFGEWEARLWFPLELPRDATVEELRGRGGFDLVGRLAPGATLPEVQSQVDALDAAALASVSAERRRVLEEGGYRTEVRRLRDDQVRAVRPSLLLLWAGVLFVLVVGCVNVATLLLVRNSGRLRELATRFAIGAGRVRVARQLVTESLVLAAVGGALGLAIGAWSLDLLELFEAYEIPRVDDVRLDGWVVGVSVGLTALVGVAAGLLPALSVPTGDLHAALRSGTIPGAGVGRRGRLRGGLVAAQVALAFVLLAGTGLLLTSLVRLQAVDPGFETEDVLAGATVVPWDRYPTPPVRNRAIDDMLASLRRVPGVRNAAVASQLPFSGVGDQAMLEVEGAAASDAETAAPFVTTVSPSYFDTFRIPIVDGRAFSDTDGVASDPVAIVDQRVAGRYWPGGSATGERFRFAGGDRWFTVVGVAGRISQNELAAEETNGAVYLPYRDSGLTFMRLALATEVPPRSVARAVEERLVAQNPDARLFWVQSMEEALHERLAFRRLPLFLMIGFAAAVLFLATLAVYGVLSQSVTERTREIGLRMALGGTPGSIQALTLRRGLAVVGAGLAAGAAGALGLTRLLAGLLYEVHPNDPRVFAAVAALLGAVGLAACLLPARRATRVDPVPALKAD